MFDCEIQARYRDLNLGGHVDNVDVLRIVEEARILFFRFAPLPGLTDAGLLGGVVPGGIAELVASQRVDYRAELRFAPFQPFRVRLWVSHIGRTSLEVGAELRVAADHEPAAVVETAMVFWSSATQQTWEIDAAARDRFERFRADPVALRGRRD